MNGLHKPGRIAGLWFIGTFVFSIPAVLLYDPVLNDADYILGRGFDTRIALGALLEILLVICNIATAVVFFPVLKRVNESVALGYVASRTVESMLILAGLISLMSVVTLRDELGATDAASLRIAGHSLVAFHDWTFTLGPQFCSGLGNGILLGYLMYRSELRATPDGDARADRRPTGVPGRRAGPARDDRQPQRCVVRADGRRDRVGGLHRDLPHGQGVSAVAVARRARAHGSLGHLTGEDARRGCVWLYAWLDPKTPGSEEPGARGRCQRPDVGMLTESVNISWSLARSPFGSVAVHNRGGLPGPVAVPGQRNTSSARVSLQTGCARSFVTVSPV